MPSYTLDMMLCDNNNFNLCQPRFIVIQPHAPTQLDRTPRQGIRQYTSQNKPQLLVQFKYIAPQKAPKRMGVRYAL